MSKKISIEFEVASEREMVCICVLLKVMSAEYFATTKIIDGEEKRFITIYDKE